jgi:glycosyltransferase involved in cell wall biosynthesis
LNQELQVDVILPFHRIDEMLFQALDSIDRSKKIYPHIILIDDRKNKETCPQLNSKLKSFSRSHLTFLENFNHGYGNAINLGLTKVKNPWVALMNSDDLVSENRFYEQILAIEVTKSDGAICKLTKFKKFRFIHIPSILGKISIESYNSSYLLIGAYGADATLVLKTEKFTTLKFSDAELCADWITAFSSYPELRLAGVSTAEYFYRIHSRQSSNLKITSNEILKKKMYDSWSELNTSLGLPHVGFDEFVFIAAPWLRTKESNPSRDKFLSWFAEYLQINRASQDLKSLREAQKRRLLILDYHMKNYSNLRGFFAVVILCEMAYKKFLGVLPG